MKDVVLWIGAGQIGMAIVRRIGMGKKIVCADKNPANAQAISKVMTDAGFDIFPMEADLSSRESILAFISKGQEFGNISILVNSAGVSPSQASTGGLTGIRNAGFLLIELEEGLSCPLQL